MTDQPTVFVGIDWAHSTHQICILDEQGQVLDERAIEHAAEELAAMCDRIVAAASGDPDRVAVAIETTHGIVVETLLERGIPVHSINPKQLDRFRDRFSMSGAKDDRRDARVLADSLRTDRRAFRRLAPESPLVVELREWSRMADDLQQERTRQTNRLRDQARRYYPQFLELSGDLGKAWILDLWALAPTPAMAAELKPRQITALLKKSRIRRLTTDQVLEILNKPAMTVAPGTTEAARAHIALLSERIRVVEDQLKTCHKKIRALLDEIANSDPEIGREQHDVTIAQSLPGVGPIVIATLLAEANRPLRERDYRAFRALAGVAPVTKRSGKKLIVLRRYGCNQRLANAAYHSARVAVQRDPEAKAVYATMRARGHTHGRALRSVADRMFRILFAMLRDHTVYRRPAAAA